MLTSSNQYIRPEYLTPLPTTLDAKKSPLALLAQTCSQIGADSPNTKLIQNTDKNKASGKAETPREKSPTSSNCSEISHKSSFKPYDACHPREKTRSPEERAASVGSLVRTPVSFKNSNSGNSGRCNSNQSANSPRTSPNASERKTPAVDGNTTPQDDCIRSKSSEERCSPQTSTSSSKIGFTSSILTSSTDPSIKDLPLGTFKPNSNLSTSSPFLNGFASPGLHLPMDLMTSSLMSHHNALKSGALSPYFNYARMKCPAGSESLAPVCRDPYCTGCSLSSHLLGASGSGGKSSCPSGCTQCDHKPPGYLGHNPAAAAYAHAQLAALAAASQLPYVCNWIAGDSAYCGKRFSSSEELLQHLRTHTSMCSTSEASAALSMLNSTGLPPTHPLLHRTYPTPPLSPLATARYHPYGKPSLLPSSLASSSLAGIPLGHPGLPPYFSPYSLYGARLGTAPGMHP